MLNKKYSLRDIGIALSRSVSTISDEIKNNSTSGKYDPEKAQHKAYVRRHMASFRGKSVIASKELRSFVEKYLLDGQSPAAISGRIKYQEKDLPYVSKGTIYSYLRSPYGKIIGLKLRKKNAPKKAQRKRNYQIECSLIKGRESLIEEAGSAM
jgi:IS30 family transposase